MFDAKQKTDALRPQILEMSKKLDTAGPDWSGIFQSEKPFFSRKISNRRPNFWETTFIYQRRKVVLAVNGEIYNHQELRKEFPDYEFLTQSDCEVILALYRKYGKDFIEKLNGILHFRFMISKMTFI